MSDGKVIAVVGATGTQGGGLARTILDHPEGGFTVRALTRNPDSDAGHALAERGADVVAADLDDEASLVTAFTGAHAVFGVTNYWEVFSVEREQAQARSSGRGRRSLPPRGCTCRRRTGTRRGRTLPAARRRWCGRSLCGRRVSGPR